MGDDDPDAALFEMVRAVVGRDVPVVATLDLCANALRRMVGAAKMLIGHRTNPQVDMGGRGAEAAAAIHEIWAGMRPAGAFVKLPLLPPSITQNTDAGPYGDLVRLAASRQDERVVNATMLSGFSNADTPKNGMSVIVTTRGDRSQARRVASEIAAAAWADCHG